MKKRTKQIITYTLLILWALIQLLPLYWMFTFSLKSNREIFNNFMLALPEEWKWDNYSRALEVGNIGRFFMNSAIVAIATIALTVISAILATYALFRMKWRGQKQAYALVVLGITIPIHSAILPVFLVLGKLHMTNSYWALILPYTAFGLSMAIMVSASFMESIPRELEEAACIDGCNVYRIMWKIIFPMMKPCISTVAIFTFMSSWNELMFAVIFISDARYKTITVGIKELCGSYTTQWGPIGAALVMATFPVLLIYAFFSEKIQQSMAAGAIKG